MSGLCIVITVLVVFIILKMFWTKINLNQPSVAVKNNPLPTKNKDNYLSTIYIHCCHYLEKVLQSKDFLNDIRQVNVPYPNRTKSLKITKKNNELWSCFAVLCSEHRWPCELEGYVDIL